MSDKQPEKEAIELINSVTDEVEGVTSDGPLKTDVSGWIHDYVEDALNHEGGFASIGSHWVDDHTNKRYAIAYDEDVKMNNFGHMDRVRFDPILDEKVVRATNVVIETRAEDFKYVEFPEHGLTRKMSPEQRAVIDGQRANSELYKKPEKSVAKDEDDKPSNPLTDGIAGSMNDLL